MEVEEKYLNELINAVIIRNNILTLSKEELDKLYTENTQILYFLKGLLFNLNYDEGFFYLKDEVLQNLIGYLECIQEKDWLLGTEEIDINEVYDEEENEYYETFDEHISELEASMFCEIKDYCQELLFYFRLIMNMPSTTKNLRAYIYLNEQSCIRHIDFENPNDLISIFSADAEVLMGLYMEDIDDIDIISFISSTNYFLSRSPYLYKNEKFKEMTKEKIANNYEKTHKIKERRLRKESKDIIKRLEE